MMPQCVHLRDTPGHLGLATETIAIDPDGSGLLPSLTRTLTRSRDNLRRPTGFVLGNEHAVGYGYDVSGRLATLSAQGLPNLPGKTHAFEYTYEPGSSLLDKVTGPVHAVDNDYEHHRDVLLQKTNTRTVGTPAELSVIGYTVNAIGQREQRNLSGENRADFYGGQTTDLYTTDWGYDALGQVIVHYEYDPFGNLTRRTGAPATRYKYRFSTKPRDPATGLYYYGYRWFDPYTGSWPSRDPIQERGGVNLYGFVKNSCQSYIDVLGRNPLMNLGAASTHVGDGSRFYLNTSETTDHARGGGGSENVDWSRVLEDYILEELELDQLAVGGEIGIGLPIPVPPPAKLEVDGKLKGKLFRCCKGPVCLELSGSLTVEGGLGLGHKFKTYPSPAKGRRNMDRGARTGRKLEHLAGKNLPWYKQAGGQGGSGWARSSAEDGSTACPPEGFGGSLSIGVTARGQLLGMHGEAGAGLVWKYGDPFTWEKIDAQISLDYGVSPTAISPEAFIGIQGAGQISYTIIESK